MKNRKVLYSLLTIILIAFFTASYSFGLYINKNNLKLKTCDTFPYVELVEKNDSKAKQTSVTANFSKVAEDTTFIFKIKYKNTGKEIRNMTLEKYFSSSKELNNKTETQLNEFFKDQGYTVESMAKNEIIFTNNNFEYSYNPEKFFIGIYNDYVAIYKTDNSGNIIANKILDIKDDNFNFKLEDKDEKEVVQTQYISITDLQEKDGLIDLLTKGSETIEFESAEQAFDYAKGLFTS